MQIYSSSSSAIHDEDSSAAVTLKMISYKLDADKMFHEISFTALSMKTVSYALPSYNIDTESSAVSVANEATFFIIIPGDLSPSSYSLSLLRNNDTAVTSKTSPYELIAIEITAPAVMKTTHDMSYDTTVPITDKEMYYVPRTTTSYESLSTVTMATAPYVALTFSVDGILT